MSLVSSSPATTSVLTESQLSDFYTALDSKDESALKSQIDTLAISMQSRNAESIDLMLQLALRTDEVGRYAESKLFNAFSDEDYIRNGIAKDIASQSLNLFEYSKKLPEKTDKGHTPTIFKDTRFSTPSKLLYMVGTETIDSKADALTTEIGQVFSKDVFSKKLLAKGPPNEFFAPESLWHSNRFCTTDELQVMADKHLSESRGDVNHNAVPQSGGNIQASSPSRSDITLHNTTLRHEDLEDFDVSQQKLPLVVPVWNRNHFSLVYFHDDKNALCFSSLSGYVSDAQKILENKGIKVDLIEGDLQDNAPNGCLMYVLEAMKKLFNSPPGTTFDDQGKKIKAFIEPFTKKSSDATPENEAIAKNQEIFNISRRRVAIGAYLDTKPEA